MKRFVLMMAMMAFTASLAVAQQPAPKPAPEGAKAAGGNAAAALPTVDEVLAKFIKATGGEEAIKKVTSRVQKGSFELPAMGASGSYEIVNKAPNLSYMKIEIGGFGAFVNVCDGKTCWSSNPMSGLREPKGAELGALMRQSDFYRELNLKTQFKSLTVKGREKLGGGSAVVIEAVPAEGEAEKLYFDETTGLLVRHDAEVESEQGKMHTETVFEDYKLVDGVNTWHTMKQTTPAFAMTVKVEDTKSNVAIENTKFSKPAAQ